MLNRFPHVEVGAMLQVKIIPMAPASCGPNWIFPITYMRGIRCW